MRHISGISMLTRFLPLSNVRRMTVFGDHGFGSRFCARLVAVFLIGLSGCQSSAPLASERESGIGDGTDGAAWSEFRPYEEEEAPAPASSPPAPRISRQIRYFDVPVEGRYVALTFDDGPSSRLTPRLLDVLNEHDVRATFFIVGRQAAAFPEIVRRIDAEGHEIGNHTWDHPSLLDLSPEAVREQLERTSNVIRAVTDRRPTLMRPPYGRTNDILNRWIAENFDLKVILWSVDSSDWRHRNADLVHQEILTGAQSGAIILTHDTQAATVDAMPEVLASLRAKGYRFVTVSELIAMQSR